MSITAHEEEHFRMLFHITDFPSFVASKSSFTTKTVRLRNTEWFIRVEFSRLKEMIGISGQKQMIAMSEQVGGTSRHSAEWLDVHVVGKSTVQKEWSLNVTVDFKSKNLIAPGMQVNTLNCPDTYRFEFNAENDYMDHIGIGVSKVPVNMC